MKARDEAAETLRTIFPKASADIRDALLVLAEAEAKVAAANQSRPDGAEYIIGAEASASGTKFINGDNGLWPIAQQVKLPARFGSAQWPVG